MLVQVRSEVSIFVIKLVALDLDDTLLDSELKISPPTASTICRAIEQGVVVTLATGRMYRSAQPFALELGLDVPLITYHGALVKTSLTKEVLYHKPVPMELARKVISSVQEQGFDVNLYQNDELYVRKGNPRIQDYSDLAQVSYTEVGDLLSCMYTDTEKLLVIDEEEKLDRLAITLKELIGDKLHITKSKPFFLEITHPEATKGQALDTLANNLGITRREVMAVGNSYNDLDMLEYAGVGVVMGNARPEIKERADFVTLTNDEHGVAEAIKRFVLAEVV